MPTLTISFGYDIHRIKVDGPTLAKIQAGEVVEVDGRGFAHEEDGLLVDHWVFNRVPGEVSFWLDNGAEYCGQEVWIDEET
jgi:hypothetical protein